MALFVQLRGALLLVLRYFGDMLHLTQLYELAFAACMKVVVERDLVPDSVLRRGIRYLLRKRLAEVGAGVLIHPDRQTALLRRKGRHRGGGGRGPLWMRLLLSRHRLQVGSTRSGSTAADMP